MAYNETSKTRILRGRGVKNHGFGEQLGPKGPNLTVQINRFDTRSEKKEYRIGNGRFKDWSGMFRLQNGNEGCGGRGGSAAEAGPPK